jgi:peptidoglycan/xylan/chitin deacetylase (PgdA/CDA1 family)
MGSFLPRTRRADALAWLVLAVWSLSAAANPCKGTLYLTFDTGHMGPAEAIADILDRQAIKATFFLANERTLRSDTSLDLTWAPYWRRLAEAGHAFGSHTWRHWYLRGDQGEQIRYVASDGKGRELLDAAALCAELRRPEERFRVMTGRGFDGFWRAPGGKVTANALRYAEACGYRHVGWSDAGFSGDELPSDRFPTKALIAQQLDRIRDGDVLLWHLGIWSRKDPLWPHLEGLLRSLKSRGFCFARLTERRWP